MGTRKAVKSAVQKRTPKKRAEPRWTKTFLAALSETANVSASARLASIGRQTAYDRRESSKVFAAKWDEATEEACDGLELEARRRAEKGVVKTIFYQGQPIGEEREYSDTLMIFLLKAHRPEKFRERYEVTGKDGTKLIPDVLTVINKIYGDSSDTPEAE